jgi:thioredoxin 1
VPTVLGVKNGKIMDRFIGLQDDDQLQTFVEKLLN